MDGKVLEVQVLLLVFKKCDFSPLVKISLGVFSFEQVVAALIVNFEVGRINLVLHEVFALVYDLEHISKHSGDNAPLFPLVASA
jgi:Ni/Fe-hydrogenase subunit HybB-like protein